MGHLALPPTVVVFHAYQLALSLSVLLRDFALIVALTDGQLLAKHLSCCGLWQSHIVHSVTNHPSHPPPWRPPLPPPTLEPGSPQTSRMWQ